MSSRASRAFPPCVLLAAALPAAAQLDVLSSKELEERRKRAAEPVLVVEPATLDCRLAEGETTDRRLTVRNGGGRTLKWSVVSAPEWVSLDSQSGELGFEGKRELVLVIDPAGLEPGETKGEISFEAPAAERSPLAVAVALVIESDTEPVTAEVEPGKPASARRRGAFGLRVGYLAPGGGADEDFAGNVSFGLYYQGGRNGRRLNYEFGLGLGALESESGEATTTMVAAQGAALYYLDGRKTLYLLGGGELVTERVEDRGFETTESTVGMALDLGAGVTLARGKVDLRATQSFLLGSSNVGGMTGVAVGYSF